MIEEIRLTEGAGYLEITFNRPHKKNALTAAMYQAMSGALIAAAARDDIACVLFSGTGNAFSAGNDLGDFLSGPDGAAPALSFIDLLAAFDKPLLAAVQGMAVGIGTTMLYHCDLIYAAPDARFAMPFVKLGVVPEAASSLLAPAVLGRAKAAAMLLLGETIGAEEADRAGMISAIIPADDLHDHARAKAESLARQPRAAMLATRRLLRPDPVAVARRTAEEAALFAAALQSADAQAAFAAFMGGAARPAAN
jgi:enoyl-CoA hydratase/carnithine racemase